MRYPWPIEVEAARLAAGGNPGDREGGFAIGHLLVIAVAACSETRHWDHVSVSCRDRCPTWKEMCYIKQLFWRDDEEVVQFHPPANEYVNNHPFVLHMWRDTRHGHRLPLKEQV